MTGPAASSCPRPSATDSESLDLFLRFGKHDACCGAHSLAEVYATLTGMPAPRRVSGDQALLFLGNISDRLTLVALDEREYVQVTEAAAGAGLAGSAVYETSLLVWTAPPFVQTNVLCYGDNLDILRGGHIQNESVDRVYFGPAMEFESRLQRHLS